MNKNRCLAGQIPDSENAILTRLKSCDPEEANRIIDESLMFLKKDEFGEIIRLLEKEAAGRQKREIFGGLSGCGAGPRP